MIGLIQDPLEQSIDERKNKKNPHIPLETSGGRASPRCFENERNEADLSSLKLGRVLCAKDRGEGARGVKQITGRKELVTGKSLTISHGFSLSVWLCLYTPPSTSGNAVNHMVPFGAVGPTPNPPRF